MLNDFIISGFKHFKAIRDFGSAWKIEIRKTKEAIGIIERNKEGWTFRSIYQITPVHLSGEQLLDLAGLIKILSKEKTPVIPDPLEDRIKLYTFISNNWDKIYDTGPIANGRRREGYRRPITQHCYYVQYKTVDNLISDIQFFTEPNFLGKLSIKIIRWAFNFFLKLDKNDKQES